MTDKPQVGSIVFGPPSDAYEYRITKSDGPTALSNTAELFAENERLRAECDALRAALTWYADNLGNSKSMDYRVIAQDGGKRAQAALAARGKDE